MGRVSSTYVARGDGERELGVLLAHAVSYSADSVQWRLVCDALGCAVLNLDRGEQENGLAHARAALVELRALYAGTEPAEKISRANIEQFGAWLREAVEDLLISP